MQSSKFITNIEQLLKESKKLFKSTQLIGGPERNQFVQTQLGQLIFHKFYQFGTELYSTNATSIENFNKSNPEKILIADVVELIHKNSAWIFSFVRAYPFFQIDLEGENIPITINQTRSGLEYMFKYFSGLDSQLDSDLEIIKELGDIEAFDDHLRVWRDGFRDYSDSERPPNTPPSHWWWFNTD